MNVTLAQLRAICPNAPDGILPALNAALKAAGCVTHLRMAMFIAQLAEESVEFTTLVERASGQEYEGRADLGNTQPGDGVRYKGRGWPQLTGRDNYQRAGDALGFDYVGNPDLVATYPHAALVASWYWLAPNKHAPNGLNPFADSGDLEGATRGINGGLSGLTVRGTYYVRACEQLAGAHDFADVTSGSSSV